MARLQFAEERLERALQRVAPDRFTIARAALGRAEIVGMLLAGLALRPASRQRRVAIIAGDEASQRKIRADVFARWRFGGALEPFLDWRAPIGWSAWLVSA